MKSNKSGFSLVELIVVILIIGVLALAIAPAVLKYIEEGRDAVAKNNVMIIERAYAYALAETQLDFSKITSDGSLIPYTLGQNPDVALDIDKEMTEAIDKIIDKDLRGKYAIYIYPTRESFGNRSGKHIIYFTYKELTFGKPGYQYYDGKITKGIMTPPSDTD